MKNSEQPAFPTDVSSETHTIPRNAKIQQGLTIRQYAAIKAMQGILASLDSKENNGKYYVNDGYLAAPLVAKDAIHCADELLKQLEATQQ